MGAAWLPGWLWRSEQHWPHILCSSAVHQLALSLALSCSAHSVTTGRRPRRCPPCLSPPCMGILKLAGYFHNGQLNQTMQERTKGLGGPAASTSPAVAYSQWSGYFRVDILVFALHGWGRGPASHYRCSQPIQTTCVHSRSLPGARALNSSRGPLGQLAVLLRCERRSLVWLVTAAAAGCGHDCGNSCGCQAAMPGADSTNELRSAAD
jgi:hypothetical protein